MDRYTYTPLPPSDEWEPFTRILILSPGHYLSPISCSFQLVNVAECSEPYEALSYVWGREKARQPVSCGLGHDGGELRITANLDRALRSLRQTDETRRLWVDALCIDQENIDERAVQVRYMRQVYRQAARVIVWLGPRVDGSDLAFGAVGMLARLGALPQGITDLERAMSWFMQNPEPCTALLRLFSREYFERLWCVQEVIVSKECVARCGNLEVDFFQLLSLAIFFSALRDKNAPMATLHFWGIIHQHRLRGSLPEVSMAQLTELISSTSCFKATDPRDRVYALLGISEDGRGLVDFLVGGKPSSGLYASLQRSAIADTLASYSKETLQILSVVIDYKKSVKDVYRDLVRFLLRRVRGALDILSLLEHAHDPCSKPDWPSWVPRFDEAHAVMLFPRGGPYMSGIPSIGVLAYTERFYDDPVYGDPKEPDCLQVNGFRVDQVAGVSEVLQLDLDLEHSIPIQKIWGQLFDFPLFPRPEQRYVAGGELDMAFFMAISLGPSGSAMSMLDRLQSYPERSDQVMTLEVMSRQAKINIFNWLKGATTGDTAADYPDLAEVATRSPDWSMDSQKDWYQKTVDAFCENRRVYRTTSGFLGLGPRIMQPGDVVTVVLGGRYPFILRASGSDWVLIGDTYLHHEDILMGRECVAVRSLQSPFTVEHLRLK